MGAPQELIEVKTTAAAKPKTARVSRKVKDALQLMCFNGLDRKQAAEQVGLRDDSLYRAMLKPDVLAYMQHLKRVLRTGEAFQAPGRISELARSADSESVRLQANVLLLDPDNEGTKTHTDQSLNVNIPGLTIVYNNAGKESQTIEGKATELDIVPHPALEDD